MASNPLYPGYTPEKPDESPGNPLSMGYYPGKKIARKFRPSSGANINLSGLDVSGGAIAEEYLDSVAKSTEETLYGPYKWVKKRLDDDFDSALTIRALPPQGIPLEQLDDYEAGSLPGGGFISLDVDLRKWIGKDERTDEGKAWKMAKKTAKSWVKGAFNFTDLETKARDTFWKEVVDTKKYNEEIQNGDKNPTWLERKAHDKVATETPILRRGIMVMENGKVATTFGEAAYGKDVYSKAANKLSEFYKGGGSGFKRDTVFDDFTHASIEAISAEVGQRLGGAKNTGIESFISRAELSKNLAELGSAKGEAISALKNSWINGVTEGAIKDKKGIKTSLGKFSKALNDTEKALKIKITRDELIDKHGLGFVKELEDSLQKHREVFESEKLQNIISALKTAETSGNPINIADISKNVTGGLKDLSKASGWKKILEGRDISGGDVLVNSLDRSLLKGLTSELSNKESEINKFIMDKGLHARNLVAQLPGAACMRSIGVAEELSNFSKVFSENYPWSNRLLKYIDPTVTVFSRKNATQWFFSHANNFGLVLDDKLLEQRTFFGKNLLYGNGVDAPPRFFGNRFKVGIDVNGISHKAEVWGGKHFEAVETLNSWKKVTLGKLDTSGNFITSNPFTRDHLKALLVDGKTLLAPGITKDNLGKLIIQQTAGRWTVEILDPKTGQRISALASEFKNLDLFAECKDLKAVTDRVEDLLRKQGGITNFRDYSIKNFFKKTGLSESDIDNWDNLVVKLSGMHSAKITTRHLGVMQKIGLQMSRLQNALYSIKPIGWAARQVNAARILLRESVRKAVTEAIEKLAARFALKAGASVALKGVLTAIAQALGSFAPVIGNLVALAVSWLVEKVISKVFGTFKNLFSILKSGDFSGALAKYEKQLDERNKKLLYITMIILVILAFFSSIVEILVPNVINIGGMVTMDPFDDLVPFALSTFSPVDETRKFGSLPQNYEWDIVLDPTGASLANGPSYGIGGGGTGACNCVPNEKRLGPMPSVSGRRAQIINTAVKIANDLQPGFWCSYNHSLIYDPPYWNQSMFESNPCPEYSSGNGDPMAMFWCTYMVDAAHGLSFNNAAVTNISGTLSKDNRYVMAPWSTPISKLKPGDIIFLKGYGHVAMVYSVTSDGVNTIESNTSNVSNFIPTTDCGNSSCPLSNDYAQIDGYALLK